MAAGEIFAFKIGHAVADI